MKVNLKVKEDNTVETIQHEVEEVSLWQISKAMVVVNDILKIAEQDENLRNLLVEIFDSAQETSEEEQGDKTEEQLQEESGNRIMQSLLGAFDVLLVNIPNKAFELLAILSDVEYDTLMAQKSVDVFDIYDAVIEVNDIQKLVNRAKKSLATTKKLTNVFKIRRNQAQQAETMQA
ncbi:hypothetical protein [Virgibacillus alimentarius]|uniref:hypothetical protein n=1 Tax=Virgibacillus alimentarius TaxID=698769 RepID=UPI000493038F|nr:hypothetical protein [Virgibacillus alimentarius]